MHIKKGGSIALDFNNKMVESQELIISEGVVLDTTFTDTEKKIIRGKAIRKIAK